MEKDNRKEGSQTKFLSSYFKCLIDTTVSQDWRSITAQRSRGTNSGCPSTPIGGNVETSPLFSWGSIQGLWGSNSQGGKKRRRGKRRANFLFEPYSGNSWLLVNSHYLERENITPPCIHCSSPSGAGSPDVPPRVLRSFLLSRTNSAKRLWGQGGGRDHCYFHRHQQQHSRTQEKGNGS